MMENREDERIRAALNRTLSGLEGSPYLARRVISASEGEKKVKKKLSFTAILVIVLLCIGVAALAETLWSDGLAKYLQITEQDKTVLEKTSAVSSPQLSVSDQGVTVTLEQCIADESVIYIALKVHGYQPPEGKQPAFDQLDIDLGWDKGYGLDWRFFDGLIFGPDGRAIYADGSPVDWDHYTANYADENGDLTFIIAGFSTERQTKLGTTVNLTLKDLGYIPGKVDFTCEVPGTWEFEWTLEGTKQVRILDDLALPIGDTGAVIHSLRISPVFCGGELKWPRQTYTETYEEEDGTMTEGTFTKDMPYLYGAVMKDGTKLYMLFDGGYEGYINENSEEYGFGYATARVLDPDNVEALLFVNPDGSGDLIEVPLP